MVKWTAIPSYEPYEAARSGQIRNGLTKRILRPREFRHYRKGGWYMRVELSGDRRVPVHKLVLLAFSGPRPPGLQCRHINGNNLDNRITNLRWGTPRENADDRIKHRPDLYLTPAEIEEIRTLSHLSLRAVAAKVGCSKSTVLNVRSGRYHYLTPLAEVA